VSSPVKLSKSLLRRNYALVPGLKKPHWLKVKISNSDTNKFTKNIVEKNRLTTVCEEAACPNIHECWSKKTCHIYDTWRYMYEILYILQR
jgi:lipoic acid synthetase